MRETLVKTEEFKDSPLGKIPKDWDVVPLGSCIEFITDYRGMTPPYVNDGIAVISAENIGDGRVKSITKYVTLEVYKKTTTRGFPKPDDVIFTTEAPVGEIALLPGDRIYRLTRRVIALRPKQDILRKRFLYWYLVRLNKIGAWDSLRHGSTVPRILKPDILSYKILLPPPEEQDKIIQILDTLDAAIAHTSSLIAKLKQMKAGLLHDLLTRGLDENGELRDAIGHPEQFKPSPLGQIPKDWDVTHLTKEIDIVHGYAFKGEYFADSPPGEVLLVPGNFHREGGLYFDENNTKYYRGEIPEITVLDNGELLIVMTDLSPRTLILGRVVQLQLPFRVLHNQRIGKIVPKLPDTWNKRFLMLVMNSDKVRRNIISNATGTTVRHTSPNRIMANIITKPNIKEQSRIVEIIDTYNTRIRTEEAYRDKLKLQKQGLIHDLLTGKIRLQ